MRPRKNFDEWAEGVISEPDFAARQNSGLRRTPEKRELLKQIRERCITAGV
jgi:hypothetical protein|tara:strand:- start:1005 stop:1157 length:153 start_codon:yes stop_codon:yes gene_type:complete